MTTTHTEADPRHTTDAGDDIVHLFCCDPDLAMCGMDLTGAMATDDEFDNDPCVVSDDLLYEPCGDPDCPDRSP